MLYRSSVPRIFAHYVKDTQLNQFNSIKRYQQFVLDFVLSYLNKKKTNKGNNLFYRLLSSKMCDENGVFNGTLDRYNGITIDTENETVADGFSEKLKRMCFTFHIM